MIKIYLLDTNILLHQPRALFGFDDNIVAITSVTLQELDQKKNFTGELGFMAREAIREISHMKGSFKDGIKLENGGTFKIFQASEVNHMPGYPDTPDNRIINTVFELKEKVKEQVILVTNDVSMMINAEFLGVEVQSYHNEHIDTDEIYTGRNEEIQDDVPGIPNEYGVSYYPSGGSALKRFTNGAWVQLNDDDYKCEYCIPKNVGQRFALHALLSSPEDIPLVILKGPAGCAKTFLSLAAGLQGYFGDTYDRLIITRSNTLSDAELGFLPGDLEEKMSPLVAPFFDNLQVLLKLKNESENKNKRYLHDDAEEVKAQIEDMMETGIIEIGSLAYMRGRSLVNSFVIIDEAQNCSINQILEIVTRAGEGTKIVLLGDPDQIDNPKLDRRNNGLVFASERMKGSELCAQVTFKDSETVRSRLSSEAAKRLTIK
ncbi:MAG: PhoH family protein [Lachnospiraceae bacterium]|nr:PhoH family protein [Lachnospiraceae bacterium]